jgi:hypothetical protein
MKKTLLSLLMVTCVGALSAQITLLDTDIVGQGSVVEQARDTLPGATTIGSGGASQTWNFSTIQQHELDTLFFLNPTPLPGSPAFPTTNLGMEDTREDSTWMFLGKNVTGLFVLGRSQYVQGNLIELAIGGTIITFPSTMGTSYGGMWQGDIVGFDVSGFPLGLDSIKVNRTADVTSNIDGWGNVTTPFGTFASLRQIVVEETIDSTWEKSSITGNWSLISSTTIAALALAQIYVDDVTYDTTRTARWWTDDPSSQFPLVEMDYEANGTVNEITWQKSSPTVGVQETVNTSTEVTLFPNPAKNQITISSQLKTNNSIGIFDVTGKAVANHRFTKNSITLSVEELKNGVYFYNIYDVNGAVLNSNKFVIAK